MIQPSEEESAILEKIRGVWASILKTDVSTDTDFFGAGAGSMDVVRLVEEVKKEEINIYIDFSF